MHFFRVSLYQNGIEPVHKALLLYENINVMDNSRISSRIRSSSTIQI